MNFFQKYTFWLFLILSSSDLLGHSGETVWARYIGWHGKSDGLYLVDVNQSGPKVETSGPVVQGTDSPILHTQGVTGNWPPGVF